MDIYLLYMESDKVLASGGIDHMIAKITSLPQIILATVDYDTFGVDDGGKVNKIYLNAKFSVLNEDEYNARVKEIEGLYALMTSEKL